MTWIVSTLLGFLFIGALVRLVLFFRGRMDLVPDARGKIGRWRLIALASLNAVFSAMGFLVLFNKTYDPLDVLIGVSLVSLIAEVTFRKGSIDWTGR